MKKDNDQESLMQMIKKLRLNSSLFVGASAFWVGLIISIYLDSDKIGLIIMLVLSIIVGIVFYILIGKELSEIINYSKKK